jgi:hypothetical protein
MGRHASRPTSLTLAWIGGVPGSHHPQYIEVLNRGHAVVEDGVRP